MGFFSKLKKFWQADTTPDDAAPIVAPDQEAARPAPAATPEPVAEEAAAVPQPEAVGEDAAAAVGQSLEPHTLHPSPATPEPVAAPDTAAPAPAAPFPAATEPQPDSAATDQPIVSPRPAAAPEPIAEPEPVLTPEPQPASQQFAEPKLQAEPTPAQQPVPAPEAQPVAAPTAAAPPAPAPDMQPAAKPAARQQPTAESEQAVWRNSLILALRQAEPKLSVWLDVLLADVDTAGPVLWERLHFLFESLEAPAGEADAFVAKFAAWVALMEYDEVGLFRSELQYRLALALDLEDEEDERNRLFLKLSEGLAKTKEQIVKRIDGMLGRHTVIDEAFWEELEEILIMADVGFEPAAKLLGNLREKVRKRGTTDPAVFKDILREELSELFRPNKTIRAINPPEVVMMIGVNGVGKTTTIAKLAHRDMMRGKKVLIAAGDTFRAAAIEQLQIWAKRVGAEFYSKGANSDPAAVAYEAMDKALAEGFDVLYLDTAGRLHTKTNLMEELHKIHRVVGKKHPGAPHRSVLVLDATTGQNALSQVKLFKEAAGVDEIILTKLDGTAKGGVVVGIALSFGVPITYIGLGEKMEDLRPFDGQDFAKALLGVED
ncbi:Signal recognition particle receptor protein FtsY [Desulfovibrio sp. DV]|uniref:signal recognition particle-docking protein FtsY n=1 Tax=Desulfovibrio sp. DV TaxID=1844708 RepID=UPI00094BA4F0|nr:signal recognition particle-docking protein FtsY [Desulfovibrio sp. DV]OLN31252.1 Signal recognition particle receptor protein FtsY [Desulfovibrio sp. DV]